MGVDVWQVNNYNHAGFFGLMYWCGETYVSCTSFLFVLAPAGVSLLATETDRSVSQFCTRRSYRVVEGDQPNKLCMQLLGHGGNVNTDLTLLDWTARGVCCTYSQVVKLLYIRACRGNGGASVYVFWHAGCLGARYFHLYTIAAIIMVSIVYSCCS